MTKYLLSDDAVEDLQMIYRDGYERFGEAHADQYLGELFNLFDLLARNPEMGTQFDVKDLSFRRHPHKAHIIIFEGFGDQVGVKILRVFYGAVDYFRQL